MTLEHKQAGNPSAPWWVIYTRHQHEKTVADTLTEKGFEVFLPLYKSVRRWKDRQKVLDLPLFPSYVFVHGGLESRFRVLSTPGVYMTLTQGDSIALVPENEMADLQRIVGGDAPIEPHPFLKCGERVRVIRGPLAGVEGLLARKKNIYRLILSVDMVAQSVAVEVNAADVEAIEPVHAPESAHTYQAPVSSAHHVKPAVLPIGICVAHQ